MSNVTGSNLLNQAFTLIRTQNPELMVWTGRTTNSIGQDVDQYDAPVTIQAQVQPVPRKMTQMLGIDWEKNYIMVYTSAQVKDIGRGGSSDRLRYDGKLFKAVGDDDWQAQDGWNAALFVEDTR